MKPSMRVAIITLMAIALAFSCLGCSASSYSLTRDKSLSTDWGTVFQFKVDPNWTEADSPKGTESMVFASYFSADHNEGASITATNTKHSSYKYSTTATYGDWMDSNEHFFSRTAKEQAQEYEKLMGSSSSYKKEYASEDHYPDYKDCSISELGKESVSGTDFRLYKMKYTSAYSDAAYENIKKDSTIKQVMEHESYYAIVKDGSRDVEITATSEKILRDFLRTLEIKW